MMLLPTLRLSIGSVYSSYDTHHSFIVKYRFDRLYSAVFALVYYCLAENYIDSRAPN